MILYDWLIRATEKKGAQKAIIYRDTYLSWRGLKHRVERRSRELETMGVEAGDFVGLMLGNVPDVIILSIALNKMGGIPIPLDPTISTRELEQLMDMIPIRGLVTRPRSGDSPLPSAPAKSGKRKRAPESKRRLQGTLLSCSLYDNDGIPDNDKADDPMAVVLITADTHGDPKPIERHESHVASEAKTLSKALKITKDDVALLTMPIFQSAGFDVAVAACLSQGATICLEDELTPPRIMKLVRERKVTVLPENKALFQEIGKLPAARPLNYGDVRFLSFGGGIIGPKLDAFSKKFGVKPISCFHLTETGTATLDISGDHGKTVGKSLPGVDVQLRDAKTGKQRSRIL